MRVGGEDWKFGKGQLTPPSARRVYVSRQMLGEIVGPREALPAHVTVVRSFAGVYPQVPREVALPPEGTPAKQADEGPLPRVLAHVQLEVLLGPDALAAEGTREPAFPLPLGGVGPQEADDGGLVGAAQRLRGRAAAAGRGEAHRVHGVVLVGLAAVGLRGDALRAGDVLDLDGDGLLLDLVDGDRLVGTGHLVAAVLHGHVGGLLLGVATVVGQVRVLPVEALQRVVQPVFLERLEVPELHPADVAGEEFVGRQSSAVVLFAVLHVGGTVPIALPALLADEGLVDGAQGAYVLEGGVLFQQPDGGKGGHAGRAPEHFFPQEGRVDEADLEEGRRQRRERKREGGRRSAAVGTRGTVQAR